jgi:hypothetical protein
MVLILFDLDLKIYLNGLENKCKKKSLLAARRLEARPSSPAPSFPRCWAARAESDFLFFLAPTWAGPGTAAVRAFSPLFR